MRLIVGTEGALAIVTEVTLRIQPLTPLVGMTSFTVPSVSEGLDLLRRVMQAGLRPVLLRLYDEDEARHLAHAPPNTPVLLSAFTGVEERRGRGGAGVPAACCRCRSGRDRAGARPGLAREPVQTSAASSPCWLRREASRTVEVSGGWREMGVSIDR